MGLWHRRVALWGAALALGIGCDDGEAPADGPSALDAVAADAGPQDASAALDGAPLLDGAVDGAVDAAPDAQPDAGPITADGYCELAVDLYCPFYLRCGRMAAPDLEGCRARFLETCNGLYEPLYAALEADGRIALDAAAAPACAAHLAAVACDAQVFDLDGPCGGLWRGLGGPGAVCGPGVESFVCAPDTTCVLGLDFCGTCQPAAPVGGACAVDGDRCAPTARCLGGVCVARALPGAPCGEAGCVLGARCEADTCQGPQIVPVDGICAADGDCPYASACVDGLCTAAATTGAPCGPEIPCNFGRCEGGVCVAPAPPGAACAAAADCVTGACTAGRCDPVPPGCGGTR